MLNQIFSLFLLITLSSVGVTATSQTLSVEEYLQKAKRRTIGLSLDRKERSEIKRLRHESPDFLKGYMQNKIREYVSSPGHAETLTYHLSQRFLVPSPLINREQYSDELNRLKQRALQDESEVPVEELLNSQLITLRPFINYENPNISPLYNLFRSLVLHNKSWDELLLGHSYTFPPDWRHEKAFYSALDPSLADGVRVEVVDQPLQWPSIDPSLPFYQLTFAPNDPRIAGSLTTPEFFARYVNSSINKNRKRGAAINRIFMCNDLIPSIPVEDAHKRDSRALEIILNAQMNKRNSTTSGPSQAATQEQAHGNNPSCYGCHRIIDPAGKHFAASRLVPHPEAAPGALVYDDAYGNQVTIPTDSLRSYATAMTHTKSYVDCQVQSLWTWYIGSDVPLIKGSSRHTQVVEAFNRVNRKTNDFIAYLLSQPEFFRKPKISHELTFQKVAPILNRCTNCHSYEGPSLNQYPFSKDPNKNAEVLKSILFTLNLPASDKRSMPQERHLWSDEDIALVKRWIQEGAKP